MIFMTTAEGVVAVDAPPTIGHNILRAVATVTKSHVTHAIYSHHHADHTGAMILYQGARFYAQSEVAGLLRQTRDPNRPLPDVTFADRLTVQAGEDRVELAYHGPNHSPGNIFTYLPAQRVLMLVDVVFPGWVPFAYLAESQNIPGWLEAPAQALGYPFHTFIGGHLTRLGTRDDVVIQQEYVADLKAQTASAIDTFNVADVYKSVDPANPWAIFRGYLDGVAAQAANAVIPRWIDRLGGADVYTLSNAYQLVESLRIDYGHLGPFGIHP
jgi:glyoxylase-like metal-dependent hydrolase (beta-lactamase superfamily II)